MWAGSGQMRVETPPKNEFYFANPCQMHIQIEPSSVDRILSVGSHISMCQFLRSQRRGRWPHQQLFPRRAEDFSLSSSCSFRRKSRILPSIWIWTPGNLWRRHFPPSTQDSGCIGPVRERCSRNKGAKTFWNVEKIKRLWHLWADTCPHFHMWVLGRGS